MCSVSSVTVKKKELYELLRDSESADLVAKKEKVIQFIIDKFQIVPTDALKSQITYRLRTNFFNQYNSKLRVMKEKKKGFKYFETEFSKWLNCDFTIVYTPEECKSSESEPQVKKSRSSISYNDASVSSRRSMIQNLVENYSPELLHAASRNLLISKGNRSGAKIMDKVIEDTSSVELLKTSNSKDTYPPKKQLPLEQTVALISDTNLSRAAYYKIKQSMESQNCKILPGYAQILKEKKKSYPKNIVVSETRCEVPIQDLLEHTSERLSLYLKLDFQDTPNKRLIFDLKYGFDGTSLISYKQKWENGENSDEHLFCSSLVPLRLRDEQTNVTIWKNPRPSSTRLCRPIKMEFVKETTATIQKEEKYFNDQIENLKDFNVAGCCIKFNLSLTMIDGKVVSALTSSSSQQCHICGATISQMNNIKLLLKRPINKKALNYGLPVLHARIRLLECVLHISYRLSVKKWRISKDDKASVDERKKFLQESLKKELGIRVDQPKQGFGSTNDGNTARIFFKNFEKTSQITGFDETLLKMFYTILTVLASTREINVNAFKSFCAEAANRYVQLYPWYYMPPSVHVLLLHGHTIIEKCELPIGMYSEEAQESRNKDIKKYRGQSARRSSRIASNQDTFQRAMLTSDPAISLLTDSSKKKEEALTDDMKNLIIL